MNEEYDPIIEVIYYRYLRFLTNGKFYCLVTHIKLTD